MRRLGFTLIELLIVIAVIAVLAVTIILTLNPGELLKQVRDSNRITDLAGLNKAIAGYQAEFSNGAMPTSSVVYISLPDSSGTCSNLSLPALPSGWTYSCKSSSTYRNVDGTGWVPLNLASSSGLQLNALPVDPTNASASRLYYALVAANGTYELTSQLESQTRHGAAVNDGDAYPGVYSTGSAKNVTPGMRDIGLLRHWSFDDASGTTARDSTGNSTDATLYGPPLWNTGSPCKVNGCIYFPGPTGRYVRTNTVSDLNGLSQYTVMFWLYSTNASGNKNLFVSSNASFFLSGSNMGLQANPPLLYSSPGTWQTGAWTHAAATYDGSLVRIYLNGTEVSQSAKSGSAGFSSYLSFGSSLGSDNPAFSGRMDELKIYSRALTGDELKAVYNAER